MKTLSKEQVFKARISSVGDIWRYCRFRNDDGLSQSALNAPFATFGGQYLYPSVQAKAAQLGFGLVCNHPFVDGNKRIGAHVMLVFLAINGIELYYTQEELIDIILEIASGRAKAADLLEWIQLLSSGSIICAHHNGASLLLYNPIISLTMRSQPLMAPTSTSRLNASSPT